LSDLLGVRKAARKDKRTRFTALLHHVTVGLLRDSYYALKRDAAPGVDGVTWKEYETDLDEKLADLHGRIHRGTYRAHFVPFFTGADVVALATAPEMALTS